MRLGTGFAHLSAEGLLNFFGDDLIKANLGTCLSVSVEK